MTTTPPLPDPPDSLEVAWPAPEYRHGQRGIFREAATVLFDDQFDIDTIVLDAPTGLGKSVINTGLCNLAASAFYTTPQRELRQQLRDDRLLADCYEVLRARRDYMCKEAQWRFADDFDCEDCPINQANAEFDTAASLGHPVSCSQCDGCTYWNAKDTAMKAPTAVLTFAYLIVDNWLPTYTEVSDDDESSVGPPTGETIQVSFADRELLVVDEAHALEGQVASLFAGFSAAENRLPTDAVDAIRAVIPDELYTAADADEAVDVPIRAHIATQSVLDGLKSAARHAMRHYEERDVTEMLDDQGSRSDEDVRRVLAALKAFSRRVTEYIGTDYDPSHPWTIDVVQEGEDRYRYEFQPVMVDGFLREHVWSRAEKVILSSATVPAYGNLDRNAAILDWVESIGLNPETTYVLSRDSPFPVANRQIYADDPIGSMSGEGFQAHFSAIVTRLRQLAADHAGGKGLIHTSSYKQANRLGEALDDIAVTHYRADERSGKPMDLWQERDRDLLITPALSEGIDLRDELCRWQAAVKVPYAKLSEPRIRYRLRELGDTHWYASEAAMSIVQAAGRGVRHMDDECPFYVLDEDFARVMHYTPPWFKDAVVT